MSSCDKSIKVINVDNKIQTEKEIRKKKYATDFYTRNYLRSIELRQNKRVDKFAGKSTWHIFREYVRVLEVVVIIKIPIFGEFITN